jgi:cation diffusion facilitator family transporter
MKTGEFFTTPRGTALISVGSNTLLSGSKISIGLLTGSVAVLSEGLHSSLDLVASVIAFFSVSVSSLPPDRKHPYGHGKIENISGTIEAILIIIAGGFIVHEAVHKLKTGVTVGNVDAGLAVMLLSVVVNIVVSRLLFKTAKKYESPALEADAHHLSTDVLTSFGVLAGLVLVRITGIKWIDPFFAMGVAAIICLIGFRVLGSSFFDLLDQSLPDEEEKKIRQIIEDHKGQYLEYHKMRTRKSGAMRYIDLHLVVPSSSHVKEAHDFTHHIEDEILSVFPTASITIHIEPGEIEPGEL